MIFPLAASRQGLLAADLCTNYDNGRPSLRFALTLSINPAVLLDQVTRAGNEETAPKRGTVSWVLRLSKTTT